MADILKRTGRRGTKYCARVRVAGHPTKSQTFTSKTDARLWAQQTEADLRRNHHFPSREHERKTLRELIDHYREQGIPESCVDAYGPHLDWWSAKLGTHRLVDIRPEMISELREELQRKPGNTGKKRGPATVNRYLNTLSAVFTFGELEEVGWIDHNPVRKVRRKPEPAGRTRFLSRPQDEEESELDRLLDACRKSRNKDLLDIVLLGILTGMREREIMALRKRYVRLTESGISLPADIPKNRAARFVALVGQALTRIADRVRTQKDYLFAASGSASTSEPPFPRQAWDGALRRAGIENFRFHDLRHTHGSYLAMTGASIRELMDALGHKTPVMAARYSHLTSSHQRKVAERLLEILPN